MGIYTFLFDIIKLLVTICMGILSLSLAFADKLNLDFKDKEIKKTLSTLWLSLILTLIFCVVSGFFIYSDLELFVITDCPKTKVLTKLFTILNLLPFSFVLISLTKIGTVIVKQKSKPTDEDINIPKEQTDEEKGSS